jgi:hypothetical protein
VKRIKIDDVLVVLSDVLQVGQGPLITWIVQQIIGGRRGRVAQRAVRP